MTHAQLCDRVLRRFDYGIAESGSCPKKAEYNMKVTSLISVIESAFYAISDQSLQSRTIGRGKRGGNRDTRHIAAIFLAWKPEFHKA
jgi:hypothetical protein